MSKLQEQTLKKGQIIFDKSKTNLGFVAGGTIINDIAQGYNLEYSESEGYSLIFGTKLEKWSKEKVSAALEKGIIEVI